jgi:predicted alpha/beta superfamily hydrolase
VTDADYAFPLVRAIVARVGGHSDKIAPFVLVGLSYAVGDTPEFSGRRDHTPGEHGDKSLTSDMPGRKPAFGEADGYRKFLAQNVLPYVQKLYNVDVSRSVFVGHSYGALLDTDILFTEPGMFGKYVLSSPSLWFNKRMMFQEEKLYANGHKDLNAAVFFSVGGLERPKSKTDDDDDIVADLREFNANLKSRHYPNLKTQIRVFEGHDHLTVFPDMITQALEWATH